MSVGPSATTGAIGPAAVTEIMRHMNTDHPDDCTLICRALGGRPETRTATAAAMSGMDSDAAYFEATVDGSLIPVRIPFSQTLTERAQVRVEIVRMYHEACERLGIPARAH